MLLQCQPRSRLSWSIKPDCQPLVTWADLVRASALLWREPALHVPSSPLPNRSEGRRQGHTCHALVYW